MKEDNKRNADSPHPAGHVDPQASSRLTAANDHSDKIAVSPDHDDTENSDDTRPVSPDMQQFIGRQLRAVYDDVAKQPVPDRFLELMRQLDSKTGAL